MNAYVLSDLLSLSPVQISVLVDGFMDQLVAIKNGKVFFL